MLYKKYIFLFIFFLLCVVPNNSFAVDCQQAEGCFEPGGAGERYWCENSGYFACECGGGAQSMCVSNGSYDCGRDRYPEYGISCSAGERCECESLPEPTYPQPESYPNQYPVPETYPTPTYTPTYNPVNSYPSYESYNTYNSYNDYPSYNTYNTYNDYPDYPSYNGYPQYPAYNAYNDYPTYNSYNTYNNPTYNDNNTYPPSFTLTLTRPTGGKITSSDNNMDCGTVMCQKTYPQNASMSLKATPNSSYWKFNGWTGDCSGLGDCLVTMTKSMNIGAQFVPRSFIYKEF